MAPVMFITITLTTLFDQLKVNCGFGLVVWDSRDTPK